MQSKALLSIIGEGQSIGFSLSSKCPVETFPQCKLQSMTEVEDTDVGSDETPSLECDDPAGKREKKRRPLF